MVTLDKLRSPHSLQIKIIQNVVLKVIVRVLFDVQLGTVSALSSMLLLLLMLMTLKIVFAVCEIFTVKVVVVVYDNL